MDSRFVGTSSSINEKVFNYFVHALNNLETYIQVKNQYYCLFVEALAWLFNFDIA